MPASLADWAQRLANIQLPAMALTVQRVGRLLGSAAATHADYQRALALDPGFTLSIFRRLANHPRAATAEIATLAHALSLLGLAPLTEGMGLPLLRRSGGDAAQQALRALYSRAGHAAHYLRHWAALRRDPHGEELALAALLRGCGEMALWAGAPETMERIARHREQGMGRESSALAVLGFTLEQLDLALARHWHLPPLVQESLQPSGAFQPRPLGVMLADALARETAQTWHGEAVTELIELSADYVGQEPDPATATCHRLAAEAARTLHQFRLPVPAFRLAAAVPVPERPTEQTETSRDTDPSADRTAATLETIPAEPEPANSDPEASETAPFGPERPPRENKLPPPTVPAAAEPVAEAPPPPRIPPTPETAPRPVVAPATPPPRPATQTDNPLQQLLQRIMDELRDDLGMERAMFAMLTPDRKLLKARFVVGADADSPLRRFQVNLEQRNLFRLLLAKPQNLWLNAANRDKLLPLTPPPLQEILDMDGFFCASLFVNGRAFGVLYADGGQLDRNGFDHFKRLAQRLGNRLKAGTTRPPARRAAGRP